MQNSPMMKPKRRHHGHRHHQHRRRHHHHHQHRHRRDKDGGCSEEESTNEGKQRLPSLGPHATAAAAARAASRERQKAAAAVETVTPQQAALLGEPVLGLGPDPVKKARLMNAMRNDAFTQASKMGKSLRQRNYGNGMPSWSPFYAPVMQSDPPVSVAQDVGGWMKSIKQSALSPVDQVKAARAMVKEMKDWSVVDHTWELLSSRPEAC